MFKSSSFLVVWQYLRLNCCESSHAKDSSYGFLWPNPFTPSYQRKDKVHIEGWMQIGMSKSMWHNIWSDFRDRIYQSHHLHKLNLHLNVKKNGNLTSTMFNKKDQKLNTRKSKFKQVLQGKKFIAIYTQNLRVR